MVRRGRGGVASEPLRLAIILALWTGQRQGDLLRLPWSAYDGQTIRLKQSKPGARVVVPVGAPLKAALDASKKARAINPHEHARPAMDCKRLSCLLA